MLRISGRTKGSCFLVLIWVAIGLLDIHNGENYGSIIYKFFVAAWFAVVGTYYLLVDLGKIRPITKQGRIRFIIASVISILAFLMYVMWNYSLETNKFNIQSEKIPEAFDGFRIVQISDLHNVEFDRHNKTILQSVFVSGPDIIVITGDMIDSRSTDVEAAISFAEKAVNMAPVYYVNGNHEARVPEEYERLKQGLLNCGVTILEDSSVEITVDEEEIKLIGINDPTFSEKTVSEQLANCVTDDEDYKILLAHRPENFDEYAEKVDLVFSGHAHGGQFIIPFVGGFVAPGQGIFPEYYEGIYTKENTNMIVSRGIGNSIIPFRINNKPEIIVAELSKIAD